METEGRLPRRRFVEKILRLAQVGFSLFDESSDGTRAVCVLLDVSPTSRNTVVSIDTSV